MTTRIFDFAQILGFELDESLINANLRSDNNGNYRMDIRVRFRYNNANMSEEQKKMYNSLSDKQKAVLDKLGRNDTYTCLFPALDLLGADELGKDNYDLIKEMLEKEGIDEGTQKQLFDKVVDFCKENGEFISLPFTTYVVPIVDVLKGTEYQFGTKDGKDFEFTSIHSKTRGYSSVSRSYFGMHTDTENATASIIRRTLAKLDDGTYNVGNNDRESELLKTSAETPTAPKLKL